MLHMTDFDRIFDAAVRAGWPPPFAFRVAAMILVTGIDARSAERAFAAAMRWRI
jgi:hypothetical protein